MTVMVSVYVSDPPLFVAVTVNTVATMTSVGVPVICPVSESIARPRGSDGLTVKDVATPNS